MVLLSPCMLVFHSCALVLSSVLCFSPVCSSVCFLSPLTTSKVACLGDGFPRYPVPFHTKYLWISQDFTLFFAWTLASKLSSDCHHFTFQAISLVSSSSLVRWLHLMPSTPHRATGPPLRTFLPISLPFAQCLQFPEVMLLTEIWPFCLSVYISGLQGFSKAVRPGSFVYLSSLIPWHFLLRPI